MFQVNKNELTDEQCQDLKELRDEIVEKFVTAFERIPVPILKKFPHFDPDAFDQLKTLEKHVQAKIRLTEKKISTAEKTESNNSWIDEKIFNESNQSAAEYHDDFDDYESRKMPNLKFLLLEVQTTRLRISTSTRRFHRLARTRINRHLRNRN